MKDNTESTPDYLGHRQRVRERFLKSEGRDMADYELLELALMIAIPRRDVKPLAKALIDKFGSFADVIAAENEDLLAVNGVKETTLAVLKLIKAGAIRMSWQTLAASDAPVINNMDVLIDYCRSSMCYQDVEEFRIVFLDTKLKVICDEIQQKGTINYVSIHPREVVKSAMKHSSNAIIMIHNHPSGVVTPSKADIELTKLVRDACETVEITLLDHLIVSRNNVYSFKTHGVL